MNLKSDQYDDVYFSAQDGLAETRHVFLEGNDLPARFAALQAGERFVIAETGFGTGLNFLAAWALFAAVAPPDARLHFISLEKFPLEPQIIAQALSGWREEIGAALDAFLAAYTALPNADFSAGFDGGRVQLDVMVGEAETCLQRADFKANAWFLDGFKPSSNPDMWTQNMFESEARLSAPAASLASFTAAGFVRRGLAQAGFDIEKRKGFGRKRDMIVGRIDNRRLLACT